MIHLGNKDARILRNDHLHGLAGPEVGIFSAETTDQDGFGPDLDIEEGRIPEERDVPYDAVAPQRLPVARGGAVLALPEVNILGPEHQARLRTPIVDVRHAEIDKNSTIRLEKRRAVAPAGLTRKEVRFPQEPRRKFVGRVEIDISRSADLLN